MAVKIKLKRLGKVRNPQYRIIVADSRTRRDGRAIEEIGLYHPKEEPSLIRLDSERAQHWLGVGAQPTEPVMAILKITGDWQRHKGLDGAEGTLRTKEAKPDKSEAFNKALSEVHGEPSKRLAGKSEPSEAKAAAGASPGEAAGQAGSAAAQG